MALVAQHADQLGGQCVIEQLNNVFAVISKTRRHRAIINAFGCRVERALVKFQGRVAVFWIHCRSFCMDWAAVASTEVAMPVKLDVRSRLNSSALADTKRHGLKKTVAAPATAAMVTTCIGFLRAYSSVADLSKQAPARAG